MRRRSLTMILAHEEIQHLNIRFERAMQDLHSSINKVEKSLRESLARPPLGAAKFYHTRRMKDITTSGEAERKRRLDLETIAMNDTGSVGRESRRSVRDTVGYAPETREPGIKTRSGKRVGRPRKEPDVEYSRRTRRQKPLPRKMVTRSAKRKYM